MSRVKSPKLLTYAVATNLVTDGMTVVISNDKSDQLVCALKCVLW